MKEDQGGGEEGGPRAADVQRAGAILGTTGAGQKDLETALKDSLMSLHKKRVTCRR